MDLTPLFDRLIPAAQAHEKWFVPLEPVQYPVPEFYHTLNPWTVGAFAVVVLVAVVGWFADRAYVRSSWSAKFEAKIRPYRDYAAGILAMTTGFALAYAALNGQLLATNYAFPPGAVGVGLQALELTVGALLLIGLFTPAAALGLLLLYVSATAMHPLVEVLDYVNFAAIAVFLLVFSRGRYSLDWFLGKPILSTPEQRKRAYVLLRVFTGFTLLWLAILKFRRPDLHLALLDRFPDFNPYVIMGWFGIQPSREAYVFLLGVVEATIGVFEIFGFLTRFAAVALLPVFLASLVFLGGPELVGHLPILGTLFVLFIYGDNYYKNRDPDRYAAHDAKP